MKRVIAMLMVAVAVYSQAAAQTNANTNAQANTQANTQANNQANVSASNQTNAAVNTNYAQRAVKVDDNFLYELLALKEIADDSQQKGLLTQLLTLDFLWNSNNNTQNMFQNVNFNAANAGLYYDHTAQAFKMVDMNTGANLTIADLLSRLQAQSRSNAAVQSGLVDTELGINLLDLLKLNANIGLLSGLVDAGLGVNVANLANVGLGANVLSGSGLANVGLGADVAGLANVGVGARVLSGLVDAGLGLNIGKLANVGVGASVLSGLADAGVGANIANIANAGANVRVPDIRLPRIRARAGADASVLSGLQIWPLANVGLDVNALNLANLGLGVNVG